MRECNKHYDSNALAMVDFRDRSTSGLACSGPYGVLVRGKPRDVLEFSHIP